ncbi:MAG: OsmC family protein [Terrimicrobiaceae bacterium]|nr:OsmC family protein [Terrimicrobiaceae bacterium]
MVEFAITYQGELHCEAVHGPSGARIETDAPVDNHGRGAAFSPTDLCATSLGVCMMTVMGIIAQKKGLDLAGTKLKVRKIMSSEPPRRIARIEVDFDLPLPAGHPDCAGLEHAARTCPVALSLHPDVEKAVVFRWNG